MKKYEFTGETKDHYGVTLRQIRALITIVGVVSAGEAGGWIEQEKCLSQTGDAWVSGNAQVYGDAWVSGNAWVYGDAQVSGNARVYGDAWVSGNAQVSGNARVYGDAWVSSNAQVSGNAWVSGNARVYGDAWVSSNARVYGNAHVYGDAQVYGNAQVLSQESICMFSGFGFEYRTTTAFHDKELGVRIVCGCFSGSLEQFRSQVINTHGEDSKNGKLYLGMANMIEYRLGEDK